MICFRDKTFCDAPCATLSCHRKFTAADRAAAAVWWSGMPGEPPVAFADFRAHCTDHRPIGTDPSRATDGAGHGMPT